MAVRGDTVGRMTGQARPSTGTEVAAAPRRLLWRYPIAFAVIAVFGLLLGSDLPAEVRRAISGFGQMLGALAVSAACMYRYRLSTGRRRHAWLLFAIAGLFGSAGAVALWVATPGGAGDPTSPANAFISFALLSGIAGIVLYPSVPRRMTEMIRIILDGVVLGGSVLYIASLTVFPQILAHTATPYPQRLLPLLSPVVEIVIATVAALLYWRAAPADRTSLGLAAIGFGLYAVSATALAVATAEGSFTLGSITDLGWIAGHVILALGISLARVEPRGVERKELSPVLGTFVMFGLFLAAGIVNLFATPGPSYTPASVLWLIVLLAVAGRQIFIILDNERLRRDLEIRVAERTSALNTANQRNVLLLELGRRRHLRRGPVRADHFRQPGGRARPRLPGRRADQCRNAHALFHSPMPDGSPAPIEGCYITEAIRQTGWSTSAEDDLYTRADGLQIPVEVTATPLIEGDAGHRRGGGVPRRDPAARGRPDEERVRLDGQPRAADAADLDPRRARTALRGRPGPVGAQCGPDGRHRAGEQRPADPADQRHPRHRTDRGRCGLDEARVPSGRCDLVSDGGRPGAAARRAVGDRDRRPSAPTTPGVRRRRPGRPDPGEPGRQRDQVLADADRGRGSTPSSAGTFVEVAIHDQGRGIPEAKLEEIFARFQQIDSSDARAKGGSGLGLAISRSLVERWVGGSGLRTMPTGGATFRFTLPTEAEFPTAEDVTVPVEPATVRSLRQ